MKCFIHANNEALAVCKRCGKAMCSDCSAYSGHSGICPECRRDEFVMEAKFKTEEVADLKRALIGSIFLWFVLPIIVAILFGSIVPEILGVVLVIVALPLIIGVIKIVINVKKRAKLVERINKLNVEIERLTKVLNDRGSVAFN